MTVENQGNAAVNISLRLFVIAARLSFIHHNKSNEKQNEHPSSLKSKYKLYMWFCENKFNTIQYKTKNIELVHDHLAYSF